MVSLSLTEVRRLNEVAKEEEVEDTAGPDAVPVELLVLLLFRLCLLREMR